MASLLHDDGTTSLPRASRARPAGTLLGGRYLVVEPIAEGGLGVVYKAYDQGLQRLVALKLVPIKERAAERCLEARGRLIREAQALARLDHPNVVPVHDVGEHEGEVFVAMAFVEGRTLAQWLAEADHPWREIVRVFGAAGAGLVAAHRVGIVHRDFKPSNVVVGHDGTVRVVDFGLARTRNPGDSGATATPTPHVSGTALRSARTPSLPVPYVPEDDADPTLTRTGARVGTPLFMAPEQHIGEGADERSDQFSFCVALYAALYGEHPFDTSSYRSLALGTQRGSVRPEPRGRHVPRWLRAAVVRGLAPAPDDRHAHLSDLLQLLERGAAPRRRGLVGLGLAVSCVLLVLGALALHRFTSATTFCADEARGMDDVWNADVEARVAQTFEKAAGAKAERWTAAVTKGMRLYRTRWIETSTLACERAYVKRDVPIARYDQQRACLAQRRSAAQQLATLFVSADASVARGAPDAVASLSVTLGCLAPSLANEAPALPLDPREARTAEELRIELAAIKALVDTDQNVVAHQRAAKAVDAAVRLGHPPVLAEALLALGSASARVDAGPMAASTLLKTAFRTALEGRALLTAAQAASALASIEGHVLGHHREGHEWARLVDSSLGGDGSAEADEIRGRTAIFEAYVYEEEDDAKGATTAAERADALIQKWHPEDGWHRARALMAHGVASVTSGAPVRAADQFREALRLVEDSVGADHPRAAILLGHLAIAEQHAGELVPAERDFGRSLVAFENVFGKDADSVAVTASNRGTVRLAQHAYDAALEDFDRAIPLFRRRADGGSEDLASALVGAGRALRGMKDALAARERVDEAGRILARGEAMPRVRFEHAFIDGVLLEECGGDIPRARARVAEARQYFASVSAHGADTTLLREIDDWLTRRAPLR